VVKAAGQAAPGGGSGGPKKPRRPLRRRWRGGTPPPDLGDIGRQFRDQMDKLFGGPGGRGVSAQTLMMVGGGIVGLWLIFGSFYIVQPNEQAVVRTFGAYSATTGPGLRVRLPWPIQTNTNVAVTDAQRTEIGGTEGADKPKESLMLTGDENIVNISFTVLWRKSDPANTCSTSTIPTPLCRPWPKAPCARWSAAPRSTRS
jgi:membrane protease subunit HflK